MVTEKYMYFLFVLFSLKMYKLHSLNKKIMLEKIKNTQKKKKKSNAYNIQKLDFL